MKLFSLIFGHWIYLKDDYFFIEMKTEKEDESGGDTCKFYIFIYIMYI